MICETIAIETENGPVIINKTDFDPDKHKVWIEQKEEKEEKEVGKKGKKSSKKK